MGSGSSARTGSQCLKLPRGAPPAADNGERERAATRAGCGRTARSSNGAAFLPSANLITNGQVKLPGNGGPARGEDAIQLEKIDERMTTDPCE